MILSVLFNQGKQTAQQARRIGDEQHRGEEAAARRILEEQERQMRGATGSAAMDTDDMFKKPVLEDSKESREEQALKKEQVTIHKHTGSHCSK